MLPSDRYPMPGHADEACEPGVARLDRRAQRAVAPKGGLPFIFGDEVVQLDEVDVVGTDALE